ncbi:UDP-glucuronic acid decarboxylase family protein [Sulfidibacter corallicola]|uniref:SDR family oxidoreductase n=1 Tax=Sulfidibacter corallicola TaxID=2818388 RepID=A0A8A4TXV9_SULCO|nr:UDP-glucuronic acid decarboxylase family protein [Sulfidibacter corallicola]QTD53802.1 SDR family oxidoreductase [Sulfidibacter corallicola]
MEKKPNEPSAKARPKRVLVTGGAGFLGSHLVERLLHAGHDVICIDNFISGSKKNIAHLMAHPRLEVIEQDIISPVYVEAEEIYNFACPASPVHYQQNPIRTIKTCVIGMLNMLGLTKRNHAKLIQASTSEVYGDPEVVPQDESYRGNVSVSSVRACYDEGKRCAETLCEEYRREHNLDIRIARIFNTYGPRMQIDDGRVVSNFIVQALRNEPITVYGEGTQTRSFCFVDDLIQGVTTMMAGPSDLITPINLGSEEEITMMDLARRVLLLTGSRSKIEHRPLPEDDPKRRRPDLTRARSFLGWGPRTKLNDGLLKTISWFDDLLSRQEESLTL